MFTGTPCIRLSRLSPEGAGTVYVKWESLSLHTSGYDRVAQLWSETLAPPSGSTIVEAANVAWCISLAAACLNKGVTLHAFLPENTALEARQTLVLLKAKLSLTPAADGAKGAKTLARQAGALVTEQHPTLFAQAHRGTAGELVAHVQAEGGRIDAFVCGATTGGLWTACAHAMKDAFPQAARLVATLQSDDTALGISQLDGTLQPYLVAVAVDEANAAREALAHKEGMLLSTAQGAVIAAALQQARTVPPEGKVFAVVGEGGERTLSLESASP